MLKTKNLILLFLLFYLVSCKEKKQNIIFDYTNENIKITVDSVYEYPEMIFSAMKLSIKNNNKHDMILFINTIDRENLEKSVKNYNKNLYFVSSKNDTCFVGIFNDKNYLILKKKTISKIILTTLYKFGGDKEKGYFNFNVPLDGNLIYQLDSNNIKNLVRDSLKADTLIVPYYINASTKNSKKAKFGFQPLKEIPIK